MEVGDEQDLNDFVDDLGNEDEEDITQSKFEKFKYFTSLILGTVCIVCIFAFLFLVPFVLDPAVSTLLHRFVDQPVTCKVTQVEIRHGSKDTNCKWSSCREGCTADIFVCYQVRVQYARLPFKNDTSASSIPESQWVDLSRWDTEEKKVMRDTALLVNIKGCGYPPDIACARFASNYQNVSASQETFPCYYSKLNPWIVLERYDFSDTVANIVASIVIPNGLFLISLVVLLYWHCPYCQQRCRKYEEQMDQDEN